MFKGFLKDTRYCLDVKDLYHLQFRDCISTNSTWIYDEYRMYIVHTGTKRCLTVVNDTVQLLLCEMEPHSIKQMWKLDFRNKDKMFQIVYPNITIEEWNFVQEELKIAPTERVTDLEVYSIGEVSYKRQEKQIIKQIALDKSV